MGHILDAAVLALIQISVFIWHRICDGRSCHNRGAGDITGFALTVYCGLFLLPVFHMH